MAQVDEFSAPISLGQICCPGTDLTCAFVATNTVGKPTLLNKEMPKKVKSRSIHRSNDFLHCGLWLPSTGLSVLDANPERITDTQTTSVDNRHEPLLRHSNIAFTLCCTSMIETQVGYLP